MKNEQRIAEIKQDMSTLAEARKVLRRLKCTNPGPIVREIILAIEFHEEELAELKGYNLDAPQPQLP